MSKCIAVLAGTYQEFWKYSRDWPDRKMVFCDHWPKFAGLEFSEVVEIGTFKSRPDALEIYQRVAPMVRPNVQGQGEDTSAACGRSPAPYGWATTTKERDMTERCSGCGAYGTTNSMGHFVSDDWLRANELRTERDGLRNAIGKVCEGWTLPADARKILEAALWPNA